MKKFSLFQFGLVMGLSALSVAAVPKNMKITDDTALYEQLSEIRVNKAGDPSFDGDLQRLASLEGRYRENLPSARLAAPIKRISQQSYQFSGSRGYRRVAQNKTKSSTARR